MLNFIYAFTIHLPHFFIGYCEIEKNIHNCYERIYLSQRNFRSIGRLFFFKSRYLYSALFPLLFCQAALAQTSLSTCPFTGISISSYVPGDTPINDQANINCFAWQQFIGLNWPYAGVDGSIPAAPAEFGVPGRLDPVVWETYKNIHQMMPDDGGIPPPWDAPPEPPDACLQLGVEDRPHLRVLSHTSKFGDSFLAPGDLMQAAPANAPNWLADRHGNPVFYEILVSQAEYEYSRSNELYNAGAQLEFLNNNNKINLPKGKFSGELGSLELKAAWLKVGHAHHDHHHHPKWHNYKLSEAYIWDGADHCEHSIIALVGLHIIHKTESNPQWIWATFEHVNNAPTLSDIEKGTGDLNRFTFYNPNCDPKPINDQCLDISLPGCLPISQNAWSQYPPHYSSCKVNAAPSYCLDITRPDCPAYPTQIARVEPISNSGDNRVADLNSEVQTAIAQQAGADSVWQHYQLIGALWSGSPVEDNIQSASPPLAPLARAGLRPSINAIPLYNTTMETYAQAGARVGSDCSLATGYCETFSHVSSSSSCQTCHANAAIALAKQAEPCDAIPNYATDYSFVFKSAYVDSSDCPQTTPQTTPQPGSEPIPQPGPQPTRQPIEGGR